MKLGTALIVILDALSKQKSSMGQSVFESFHAAILGALETQKGKGKAVARRPVMAKQPADGADHDEDPPGGGEQKQEQEAGKQEEATPRQEKLILDATVAEQAIRYPTDLSLFNEAREFSEQIIDVLYPRTGRTRKPRT